MASTIFLDPSEARQIFTDKISYEFAKTPGVGPMFATMRQIISEQNKETPTLQYHGAIRLGSPEEMELMRRFFSCLGMEPVAFYDFSNLEKPLPVIGTAFRPITREEIDKAPFRMFTSMLQVDDLISEDDPGLAKDLKEYFSKRKLFSDICITLIKKYEENKGLSKEDYNTLIKEATQSFKYNSKEVPLELYKRAQKASDYAADVVVGTHLNHLTPNTKNIIETRALLVEQFGEDGMLPATQGPMVEGVTVQLKQDSFKAPPIPTTFIKEDKTIIEDFHTACFGEFEQRGLALTPKGSELLKNDKHKFPHSYDEIYDQELGYYIYKATETGKSKKKETLEKLPLPEMVKQGLVARYSVTYEDFLAASARAIFNSTVRDDKSLSEDKTSHKKSTKDDKYTQLVSALGGIEPKNPDDLYRAEQQKCLEEIARLENFPNFDELVGKLPANHPLSITKSTIEQSKHEPREPQEISK